MNQEMMVDPKHAYWDNEFREFFERGLLLLKNKGNDYAEDSDRFSNFKRAERVGIPAYIGAFIRLGDKFSRLEQLLGGKEAKVKEESVADTLIDLANYANIVYQLYLLKDSKI